MPPRFAPQNALQHMRNISTVYKDLLDSGDGDILVKLKDDNQIRVISYLIKNRSPVFKSMLDSSMKEAATGVVDLSSEYSLEAFREVMAYIYYNKLHTGSYVPLMFEILCIAEYYDIEVFKTYIKDRILKLIVDVPICLMIAAEALKHGTVTSEIYNRCLAFLVVAIKPQMRACYDKTSVDKKAWCCSDHSTKTKETLLLSDRLCLVDGKLACIHSTLPTSNIFTQTLYTQRCCVHGPSTSVPPLVNVDQLPGFIVEDVNSAKIDADQKSKSA